MRLIRGTRDYRVELVRDRNRFTGSCECPYYADRAEICKHIWAALLEAEDRQLLGGDGPVGDDAVLDPEYGRARLTCSSRPKSVTRVPASGPPPSRRRRGSASSTNSGRTWRRPKAPCRCPGFRTARSSTRSTSARRWQDGAPWSACSSVSGGRAVRGPSRSPSASPRPKPSTWSTVMTARFCRCSSARRTRGTGVHRTKPATLVCPVTF